jgi:putative oxidoreductase
MGGKTMVDRPYISLIGRFLLGFIFVLSGFQKVADPGGTQVAMQTMGITWATTWFYLGAIAMELIGGVSLLLGLWSRMGAALLVLFMIPTTLIFHSNFEDHNQTIHFMKNLALIGGLLYVYVYGPGNLSIDEGAQRAMTTTDHTAIKHLVNQ